MHGIPINVTGNNFGTITNSCIVTALSVEVTDDSKGGAAYLFQGAGSYAQTVGNRIAGVGVAAGDKSNSEDYGYDGILAQDALQCVTTANVSWAGIAVRYYAG